jgi:hypothetical protein
MARLTQFNAYNFHTTPYDLTTALTASFTPDADDIYLIKGVRLTNYSTGTVTVDIKFYSGADTTDYWVLKALSMTAGASSDVFTDNPMIISGISGDRLKMNASSNTAVHATITAMELGKHTGF